MAKGRDEIGAPPGKSKGEGCISRGVKGGRVVSDCIMGGEGFLSNHAILTDPILHWMDSHY